MIKTLILLAACFYIVGMAGANSYEETHIVVSDSPNVRGSVYSNAYSDQTETQLACVGTATIDSQYSQNKTNETRDNRINFISDKGYESQTLARFKASYKGSWSTSSDWFSRGSDVSAVSSMSVNDDNLSTNTQIMGTGNLWTRSQAFTSGSWKPDSSSSGLYSGALNASRYNFMEFQIVDIETIEDYLPCTSCLEEADKTVSYSASGVAYAGYGTAYAARGVNSTGLQGNGTVAYPITVIPVVKLGKY